MLALTVPAHGCNVLSLALSDPNFEAAAEIAADAQVQGPAEAVPFHPLLLARKGAARDVSATSSSLDLRIQPTNAACY